MERELTLPVEIADDRGRLRRDAIGWSRHPVQRCRFPRGTSRAHAFDYWCVTTRSLALTALVADVGFAGAALVSFLDLADGARASPVERVHVRPLGLSSPLPDSPDGEVALDAWWLKLTVGPRRILARARTITGSRIEADLAIERPAGHETVNVLVPWDDERFHFTSKEQALPVRGVIRVAGREHRLDPSEAFACRDYGRGRWPSGIDWCWAFASGRSGGRTIGLNLGSRWTDGTGVTENAVVVDGRVHKIADAVDFAFDAKDPLRTAWWIRSRTTGRVDLSFTPLHLRAVGVPPLVRLRQCVGRFSGVVLDDQGAPVALDDVVGVAESVHGRWGFGPAPGAG